VNIPVFKSMAFPALTSAKWNGMGPTSDDSE
jgi:hypothetical protein